MREEEKVGGGKRCEDWVRDIGLRLHFRAPLNKERERHCNIRKGRNIREGRRREEMRRLRFRPHVKER